jgi:hypothetical protein
LNGLVLEGFNDQVPPVGFSDECQEVVWVFCLLLEKELYACPDLESIWQCFYWSEIPSSQAKLIPVVEQSGSSCEAIRFKGPSEEGVLIRLEVLK